MHNLKEQLKVKAPLLGTFIKRSWDPRIYSSSLIDQALAQRCALPHRAFHTRFFSASNSSATHGR